MRGGDSDRMSRPPSFRPSTNHQALTMLPMQKDVGATSVPPLTMVAYFSRQRNHKACACCPTKESGPSIWFCTRPYLMPEVESCLVKGCQPLMIKESAAEEEGVSDWPHIHGLWSFEHWGWMARGSGPMPLALLPSDLALRLSFWPFHHT